MKIISTVLLITQVAFFSKAQTSSWVSLSSNTVGLDSALAFCNYVADINNDKYPDIVTVEGGWGPTAQNNLRVYINVQKTGSTNPKERIFLDVTGTSGINAMPTAGDTSRGTLVVALADINNDGNVDVVRGNYYHRLQNYVDVGDRCEVLLGDGQGHFTLVPNNGLHDLGLINPSGFSFLDYDKDGILDLFIAVWFNDYDANTIRSGYLMKGNGNGTFTNVSSAAGIALPEPMYGCSAVDWNNDGWPDIATAPYCRTGGQLWKNKGDGTFENVAASANYNAQLMQGDNGQNLCLWSAAPEDFDNDGDLDFFYSLVHGGSDPNEGHSTIVTNAGAANNYQLSWEMNRITWDAPSSTHHGDYDAAWLDIDNDGLEDIVMTQGTYMPTDRLFVFYQKPDNTFDDITQELGLLVPETKDLHLTEAIDYDLDGDDDFIFCRVGQPRALHLVKNEIGDQNNWTAVRLIAPAGVNKDAIGARITVFAGGLKKMREVYAGRGNDGGQQPLAMIMGLGQNTAIDSIQVQWPNAANTVTTVAHPPIKQYLTISDGGLDVKEVASKTAIDLKVYPNPAAEYILFQLTDNAPIVSAELFDMTGKSIRNSQVISSPTATSYMPVTDLPAGSYMIKVVTKKNQAFTRSFLKK